MKAMAKLTQVVDGQPRIISDPPLVVPLAELVEPDDARRIEAAHPGFCCLSATRCRPIGAVFSTPTARSTWRTRSSAWGASGTRAWIVLLLGRDADDPLFLQVKEAEPSVLEPFAGRSGFAQNGQRVVEGQRLMQAASDIFLGWLRVDQGVDGASQDYYVRQL